MVSLAGMTGKEGGTKGGGTTPSREKSMLYGSCACLWTGDTPQYAVLTAFTEEGPFILPVFQIIDKVYLDRRAAVITSNFYHRIHSFRSAIYIPGRGSSSSSVSSTTVVYSFLYQDWLEKRKSDGFRTRTCPRVPQTCREARATPLDLFRRYQRSCRPRGC